MSRRPVPLADAITGLRTRLAPATLLGEVQRVWADAIPVAIASITEADFLSDEQKRDILYNNAARFLRFTPEQIAKHHKP